MIAASIDPVSGEDRLENAPDRASLLQTYSGVPFMWLRVSRYSGNGLSRIRNMIEYGLAVLRSNALKSLPRPDAVIGSTVHPLAAWAGLRLARRHKVPFIFEVRDLWPQTLIDMGRIGARHPLAIALRMLERHLFRNAARVIVLGRRTGEYMVDTGGSKDRVVWIPNGADLELYSSAGAATQSNSAGHQLFYIGAHGNANDLENLIRAMRIVQESPRGAGIMLNMVGDGPLRPSLIALAEELGLDNVRFRAPVPKASVPSLLAEADSCVICVRDLPRLYRFGISMNKIFDYMAAAKPIVMSANVPDNPVIDGGAGICVPPEDPAALAAGILNMAALSVDQRMAMGEAGRRHLEAEYSMKALSARLAEALDASVASNDWREPPGKLSIRRM